MLSKKNNKRPTSLGNLYTYSKSIDKQIICITT